MTMELSKLKDKKKTDYAARLNVHLLFVASVFTRTLIPKRQRIIISGYPSFGVNGPVDFSLRNVNGSSEDIFRDDDVKEHQINDTFEEILYFNLSSNIVNNKVYPRKNENSFTYHSVTTTTTNYTEENIYPLKLYNITHINSAKINDSKNVSNDEDINVKMYYPEVYDTKKTKKTFGAGLTLFGVPLTGSISWIRKKGEPPPPNMVHAHVIQSIEKGRTGVSTGVNILGVPFGFHGFFGKETTATLAKPLLWLKKTFL
uniref:(California timema) hypothetical protein n=1 Tax=Timema californicum TaxID=61474 RepID=A0A7R9JDP4_TIMCA|nr:unnamed protein product [Timema californicum]